jgi:hypothetical protein
MRIWFRLIATLVAVAAAILAQESRGSIVGRVSDTSGAVVPGVALTATNVNTGISAPAKTNDQGNFQILFLNPGMYRVTAELKGFKRFERDNIEVRVNDRIGLDIEMQVGDVTQNVLVSAETPLLQTASANVGQVVDNRRIVELPLAHGNATSLIMLTPGVNMNYPAGMKYQDPMRVAQTTMMAVNGAPWGTTEFTMDGIPNTQTSNADVGQGISNQPPADAIQEFKVETAFDASVGHTSGTVINAVIKSGTNQLHGSAYGFFRDPSLNANSFFGNRSAQPRGEFTYRRWGTSLGGPVYIPKLYNGKDRTFFMYAYEGLHEFDTNPYVLSVPMPQQLKGDFSSLLAISSQYQIYDPNTIAAAPNGRFSRQPFAGNIIPPSRISPIALEISKLWPAPNVAGAADGTNNFSIQNRAEPITYYNHLARIDHMLAQKHRMFGRYAFRQSLFGPYRNRFANAASGNNFLGRPVNVGVDDVWLVNPSTVVNFRYGLQRFPGSHFLPSQGFDLTSLGFPKSLVDQITFRDPMAVLFPNVNVAGLQALQTEGADKRAQTIHSFFADVNRTAGSHSLKFGADFRMYQETVASFGAGTPTFTFDTAYTRGPLDNSPTSPSSMGQGMAALLLGIPSSGGVDWNDTRAVQSPFIGLYVQDNWRVTQRLTLNLGLRWEYEGPETERYNRTVRGFDFAAAQPLASQVLANYAARPIPEVPASQFKVQGGLLFAGAGGQPRGFYPGDHNDFQPRFGLSYQAAKGTVVRGGYGMYRVSTGQPARRDPFQLGYSLRTNIVPTLDNGLHFVATLANPFPSGIQRPAGNTAGVQTYLGRSISFFDASSISPYTQRWSLNVQQLLPGKFLVEIGYVGNRASKLLLNRNLDVTPSAALSKLQVRDQPVIDRLSAQVTNPFYPLLPGTDLSGTSVSVARLMFPYPQFSGMTTTTNQGYSWYHGAQLRGERRFANGFTLQAAYTYSKYMEATSYLNADDPLPARTVSQSDRPHNFTSSGIWELPFGAGRRFGASLRGPARAIVSGWQVGAVFQMYSGQPLAFGNIFFNGNYSSIPLSRSDRNIDRWFNVDAGFVKNTAQQPASNYRYFPLYVSGARSDNYNNWDITLLKKTKIYERVNAEFRTDFLNAFNHPTFSAPNVSVTSTAFGKVTGEDTWPRYIQFGIKLTF